ncbi:hypothetical protein [Amphritea sp. HPY]|uniref:hypothetical protein n=1 Tax=Amphritea sp. HPY TaxID=3421652 RepID=UPI003D7DADA3
MSPSLGRFLAIEQGVVPGLFNFFINGGIAWWLNRELEFMPLWGGTSIIVDTLATALLLPLLTCLIVTPIIASQMRRGKLAPLPVAMQERACLPSDSSLKRGLIAGIIGMLGVALPVLVWWSLYGPRTLELYDFLWFKASFAAILGAGITALIAWWALLDASRRQAVGNDYDNVAELAQRED